MMQGANTSYEPAEKAGGTAYDGVGHFRIEFARFTTSFSSYGLRRLSRSIWRFNGRLLDRRLEAFESRLPTICAVCSVGVHTVDRYSKVCAVSS